MGSKFCCLIIEILFQTEKLINFILEQQERRLSGESFTINEENDDSVDCDSFLESQLTAEALSVASKMCNSSSGNDSVLDLEEILEKDDPFASKVWSHFTLST